jgi:hypothetical protein
VPRPQYRRFRILASRSHHNRVDPAVEQRPLGGLFAWLCRLAANRDDLASGIEHRLDDLPAATAPRLIERPVGQRDANAHLLAGSGRRYFLGAGKYRCACKRRAADQTAHTLQKSPAIEIGVFGGLLCKPA